VADQLHPLDPERIEDGEHVVGQGGEEVSPLVPCCGQPCRQRTTSFPEPASAT
jgi:hypothetical protein